MRGKATALRVCAIGAVWCGLAANDGRATTVTLSDANSTASFDTQPPSGPNPAGQFNWVVDGVNQLYQQWFWFRIGNNPEQSLDALPQTNISVNDINFNPGNDHLAVEYTSAPLRITTTYSLVGGAPGTGSSDLGEQIKIENLSAAALDFHFFQYVDFDLNGTPGGDVVAFVNPNSVLQQEGASILSETVNTTLGAASTHREVAINPFTITNLTDGLPTTLNDFPGPIGPANVTWAFQWDFVIPGLGSVTISKDKVLNVPSDNVPEPASLGLMTFAGLLALRRRRPA